MREFLPLPGTKPQFRLSTRWLFTYLQRYLNSYYISPLQNLKLEVVILVAVQVTELCDVLLFILTFLQNLYMNT
jgi:hypothetical protein